MSALTRWVLAHKRIVIVFWVLATIVGSWRRARRPRRSTRSSPFRARRGLGDQPADRPALR